MIEGLDVGLSTCAEAEAETGGGAPVGSDGSDGDGASGAGLGFVAAPAAASGGDIGSVGMDSFSISLVFLRVSGVTIGV